MVSSIVVFYSFLMCFTLIMVSRRWRPKYQFLWKPCCHLWFSIMLVSFWSCLFIIKLYSRHNISKLSHLIYKVIFYSLHLFKKNTYSKCKPQFLTDNLGKSLILNGFCLIYPILDQKHILLLTWSWKRRKKEKGTFETLPLTRLNNPNKMQKTCAKRIHSYSWLI